MELSYNISFGLNWWKYYEMRSPLLSIVLRFVKTSSNRWTGVCNSSPEKCWIHNLEFLLFNCHQFLKPAISRSQLLRFIEIGEHFNILFCCLIDISLDWSCKLQSADRSVITVSNTSESLVYDKSIQSADLAGEQGLNSTNYYSIPFIYLGSAILLSSYVYMT